jgi:hypothetical protein
MPSLRHALFKTAQLRPTAGTSAALTAGGGPGALLMAGGVVLTLAASAGHLRTPAWQVPQESLHTGYTPARFLAEMGEKYLAIRYCSK